MAKTKSSYTGGNIKGAYGRRFSVRVSVVRTGYGSGNAQGNNKAFQACASTGSRRGFISPTCAYGKNPRKAVGAALKALGAKTSKRSGAFAGMK